MLQTDLEIIMLKVFVAEHVLASPTIMPVSY